MSPWNHQLVFAETQRHVIDPTNSGGALDDSIKHRLYVRGRAADDAEHLGSCRLMLKRLAQLRIALFELAIARLKLFGEALYFFFELAKFGSVRTLFLL